MRLQPGARPGLTLQMNDHGINAVRRRARHEADQKPPRRDVAWCRMPPDYGKPRGRSGFCGGATLRFGGHPLSCVRCPPRTFRPAGHQTIERMSTLTNATAITDKTRELCQIILDHPIFQTAQARIQAFVANDQARTQYETLVDKGQELRHRQHHGETLGEAEVRAFETEREALLRNPVARGFVDAQSGLPNYSMPSNNKSP